MFPEDKIVSDQAVIFKKLDEYQPIISDSFSSGTMNDAVITETFIQTSPVEIISKTVHSIHEDWMVYTLLILLFGISLVWYYFPERVLSIFKISKSKKESRVNYSSGNETPGMMILFFFIFNYLIAISLFLYLSSSKLFQFNLDKDEGQQVLFFFIAGIITLYVFRILIIFFTGYIFKTNQAAQHQLNLYINIDNIIGVILIPILILILFVQVDFIIYTGIGLIIILYLVKWFQTIILANSISGFSVLHLFMYLCALELLPVAVLIKLFNHGFI